MMIHFIRSQWLYLLIPALIYLGWVIYSSRQTNPWRNICDPHLLQALLLPGPHASRRFFHTTLFIFYIVSIVALAGPTWEKTKLPIYRDIASTMLILDLSSSMQSTDLKPDRLVRAKFKIRDLINASPTTQMGLVVFTAEAFVVAPLSQDASTLNALLDELNPQMMPLSGSDVGEGLTQAVTLLKQTPGNHGNFLLITGSEPTANSWNIAKEIAQSGNQLNILAMIARDPATQGTIDNLEKLARAGGGSMFLFTPDGTDIKQILNSNNTKQVVKDEDVDAAYVWQDNGPWLCLFLIPLALLVLREKVRHEK